MSNVSTDGAAPDKYVEWSDVSTDADANISPKAHLDESTHGGAHDMYTQPSRGVCMN